MFVAPRFYRRDEFPGRPIVFTAIARIANNFREAFRAATIAGMYPTQKLSVEDISRWPVSCLHTLKEPGTNMSSVASDCTAMMRESGNSITLVRGPHERSEDAGACGAPASGPATTSVETTGPGQPAEPAARKLRISRRVAIDVVRGLEIAGVAAGAIVAQSLFGIEPTGGLTVTSLLSTGCLVGWFATEILARQGQYDPDRLHDLDLAMAPRLVATAIGAGGFLWMLMIFGIATAGVTVWLATTALTGFAIATLLRAAARLVLTRMCRAGYFDIQIAVIGVSPAAQQISEHLEKGRTGHRLVGVFDDRSVHRNNATYCVTPVGTCADLAEACRAGLVDRVIVTLPPTATHRIMQVTAEFERLPVTLDIATHLTRDMFGFTAVPGGTWLGPIGLVPLKRAPLADWGSVLKSLLDYAIALALLPALLPVFAVIAIAIKLDSTGPVFFTQNRKGYNQRPFRIWKFRTMTVMEDGGTIRQATKHDPRVTRVGAVLRRTSLDELPQIFNVLLGHMSVVGPRPHALAHDRQWEEDLFLYAGRQQVKPGITGWAQVNGLRGEISGIDQVKARVDHDLYYIRHWSIWLDLKILLLTPLRGFVNRNAY